MASDIMALLGPEGIAVLVLILGLSAYLARATSLAGRAGAVGDTSRLRTGSVEQLGQRSRTRRKSERANVARTGAVRAQPSVLQAVSTGVRFAGACLADAQSEKKRDDEAARLTAKALRRPATVANVSARAAQSSCSLAETEQWSRLNAIIGSDLERTRKIGKLHDAAQRQLDAVDYAYERMLLELSEILPQVRAARDDWRVERDKVEDGLRTRIAADEVSSRPVPPRALPGSSERVGRSQSGSFEVEAA